MKTMFTSTGVQDGDSKLKSFSLSHMSEKQMWQWFHNGCRTMSNEALKLCFERG